MKYLITIEDLPTVDEFEQELYNSVFNDVVSYVLIALVITVLGSLFIGR